MKNNKGITLIALVVTIIVLLILAGVSIAMLTGQNGILNRASQASYSNDIGEAKDQIALTVANCTSDYFSAKYAGANDVNGMNSTSTTETLVSAIKSRIQALSIANVNISITAKDGSSGITIIKVESTKQSGKYAQVELTDLTGALGPWDNQY